MQLSENDFNTCVAHYLEEQDDWVTMPEEGGTINVILSVTVEQILPEGYHTIEYVIEDLSASSGGAMSGYWFVDGPKYAAP